MDYFIVYHSNNLRFGTAFGPEGADLFLTPYSGYIDDWNAPKLDLRQGEASDYLANDRCLNLCSERLKEFFAAEAGPKDILQWLDVKLVSPKATEVYYALYFPEPLDAIDKEKSTFGPGQSLMKPVFRGDAVLERRIFSYQGAQQLNFLVDGNVKERLVREGFSGFEFRRAKVAKGVNPC